MIAYKDNSKQTVMKRYFRSLGVTNKKGLDGKGTGNVINNVTTGRQQSALPLLNALGRRLNLNETPRDREQREHDAIAEIDRRLAINLVDNDMIIKQSHYYKR